MSININYFLLLLFSLIHLSLLDKYECPDKSKLPNSCSCFPFPTRGMELEMSCRFATVEELEIMMHLINASTRLQLHLHDMSGQIIFSKIFDGWNVVMLEITFCDLDDTLDDEPGEVVLPGLENSLRELIIKDCFDENYQPTKLDFSHLRRLKDLFMSRNNFSELSDDWFSRGPKSLRFLQLPYNHIQKIGDRAFANLTNLVLLSLDGNRFGPIKRSILPSPAFWLEIFRLNGNGLTSVSEDFFSEMPRLTELNLIKNKLTQIPKSTFESVWSSLEIFDISGNPIECDSRIDWIIEAKSEVSVSGTCSGPKERSGMQLKELLEGIK